MSEETHLYRVIFQSQNQIYEVYARELYQSELHGFIEVEDYVFNTHSQVLVDPSEDRLRNEFDGVRRSYIPMHAVIRIDEVEREGQARIKDIKGDKVTQFPVQLPPHRNRDK